MILGIILFILLVVIHEYGHFLVAKRNGVDVEEFGIGFPPKIAGKTMGKGIFRSYYTINLLPLGGFVRLKGEQDMASEKGSFGAASFWDKTKIAMAGVVMNYLTAAVIFTVLALTSMPQLVDNQFRIESDSKAISSGISAYVVDEVAISESETVKTPSSGSGIEDGTTILSVDGQELTSEQAYRDYVAARSPGDKVDLVLESSGEEQSVTLEVAKLQERTIGDQTYAASNITGITPIEFENSRSTWSAPIEGVGVTAQISWLTFKGIATAVGSLFQGDTATASAQVAGPVGIFSILSDVSELGLSPVFYFIGTISVALAVMNTLPIPALDGGRLFVMSLFRALKKPLTPEIEQRIHGTGMVVLLGLMALITVVDIRRIF